MKRKTTVHIMGKLKIIILKEHTLCFHWIKCIKGSHNWDALFVCLAGLTSELPNRNSMKLCIGFLHSHDFLRNRTSYALHKTKAKWWSSTCTHRIWWRARIAKFLVVQFSAAFIYSHHLKSKNSPQHPKHYSSNILSFGAEDEIE